MHSCLALRRKVRYPNRSPIVERTPLMATEQVETRSDGFSAEERAAMKERAAELRAEGKKGAKRADGLQAVLDSIEKMAPPDRALAERVHVAVTTTAPQLVPKTCSSRTRASSTIGTRPSGSRTPRTWTTATCGRVRTRSRPGPPSSRRGLSSWFAPRSPERVAPAWCADHGTRGLTR